MPEPTSAPTLHVSAEARASLLDHLSRSGAAQLIRIDVGFG